MLARWGGGGVGGGHGIGEIKFDRHTSMIRIQHVWDAGVDD